MDDDPLKKYDIFLKLFVCLSFPIDIRNKQPHTPLWTSGKGGENQSTNHLVDILNPSSTSWKPSKRWKIHSKAEEVDKR